MTGKPSSTSKSAGTPADGAKGTAKQDRLSQALRENLRKRKAQARARKDDSPKGEGRG